MSGTFKNNFVRADGVIKEQVGMEEKASRRYDEKWAFLTKDSFNAIALEIARERGISEKEYFRRQPMITLGAPPKMDLVTRRMRKKGDSLRNTQENKECVAVESGAVPLTTSGVVGWRSARNEYSLERDVGPLYISPKHTMVWQKNQIKPTSIFLG